MGRVYKILNCEKKVAYLLKSKTRFLSPFSVAEINPLILRFKYGPDKQLGLWTGPGWLMQ